jgi:predicted TIM-barrel fold metal-dependent hydrolase
MDEAGIDVAILSLSAPGLEQFEPSAAAKVAKRSNNELADAISRHPERFRGFAALSAKDTDPAVEELERCVKELGFVGWKTHSNFGDSYLDEKRYWPLLAKAEELGALVYIHPDTPIMPQLLTYGWGLAGAAFGYGVEASLVVMRLIIGGVFDVFPKLKVILGHYGEGLPFLMDRVNRPYEQGLVHTDPAVAPVLRKMPADYLRENMVVSTSGNYSTDAFVCTKSALGLGRMVLGTDYPYESMRACMDFLESQVLSPSEREQLYSGSSRALGVRA